MRPHWRSHANPTTDNPAEDSYVLERTVTFLDGAASNTDAKGTAPPASVQPLLDILTALAPLRQTQEGAYDG